MIETRWEMKIGSPVRTSDGEYGHLQQILLDPCQEHLVALVVRRQGLAPFHEHIVPKEKIAAATDSQVQLNICRDQLEALPEFRSEGNWVVDDEKYVTDNDVFAVRGLDGFDLVHAPLANEPGWIERYPEEATPARLAFPAGAGQQVYCKDGYAGRATLALLNPQGKIKGFVLHNDQFSGRERIVPAVWIQEFDTRNIYLIVEKCDLDMLPEYAPDESLAMAVDRALWADEILRHSDYQEIGVSVKDGVVWLRGHVTTPMNRTRAGHAVSFVTGVLGLKNDLVIDEDLVIDVAQTLGKDERTRSERISIGAQNGVIRLVGQVGSAAIREAVEVVAAGVPQVRGVENYLRAPGANVDPRAEQVRQPPIGRSVYATDGLLGHVEQVVIDPRNRRVTAFVTAGWYSLPKFSDKDTGLVPVPCLEHRLLVPMNEVRFETDESVLLTICTDETAQGHDYRPAGFIRPPEGWQPPYPYRWEEVLFSRERADEVAGANKLKW